MIGALTGIVFSKTQNAVLLMVGGVGYAVSVPERVGQILGAGQKHTLYIHTRVEDERIALYGFPTSGELALFELLLTVSGVGPRTALAIINRGESPVRKAVQESDVAFFTTIPRVGTKNAQKIIIELKSKLGSSRELDLSQDSGETNQVLEALLSMGFERNEAIRALRKLDDRDITLADKIRHALQLLGR
jgi:Holliday junction DNA helicase RuvA